jgi:phosphoglycerol transferase MdoB-like AlkP superfamily enzyme
VITNNKNLTNPLGVITCGPYTYLLRMALLSLIVLSVSRVGLALWNYDRAATGGLSAIFLQGIRADIILVSIWIILPVLCAPILAYKRFQTGWFRFTYYWSLSGLILFLFMELATPAFMLQYDVRPNRLFIEYLRYPKEVLSTLWNGFRLPLLGGIFLTVLIAALLNRLLKLPQSVLSTWSPWKNLLLWPVAVVIVSFGIRSTTDHRAANPAFFAITGDAMVNSIVINSTYSVLYALYSMKHEARSSEIYGKLPHKEMLQYSLDWPWLKSYQFNNPEYPTLHFQTATTMRARPLNLVIILQESMGATFVKSLGGLAVTPELEKLKSEGIWFDRLFATGTRSVRGIEAVIAGYLPTPAQSVVKLSNSQNNFTTLGSVLQTAGYATQFIYGGEAHFDNMRGFFTNNGFKDIVDLPKIKNPTFVGSWGASDEDLFTAAHKELQLLHRGEKPFFSLIFTSSNHEPFEFPDDRIDLHEQPKNSVNNAVKYADWAMGRFIATAKQSDYWKDTVFLIVADHDNRVYGNNLIPVEKFQIPGLILGGPIQPETISAIASQIDLAPTLLSLVGVSSCHTMVGRDFTLDKTTPGRAFLQFENYFALMEDEKIIVLKPNAEATIANYDQHTKKLVLSNELVTDTDKKRALAHVQLPSYLYRERRYVSNPDCIKP